MYKWNMIIDVAECTNCQLCALVGHGRIRRQRMARRFRADAAPRPPLDRHPAEGARPGADDRHRLCPDHVQPLRQRAMPCQGRRRGDQARRRHRHHRSGEGQGPQGPGRKLPLRPHLVERGIAAAADLAVRRAPARPGLEADPRPAGLPDRRHARDQGRGRRDGADRARAGARGDEARSRHQAARLLPQPLALFEMLHRRQRRGARPTARSIASKARPCASCKNGATVATATTDNYGDFKFDKLDENSGRYTDRSRARTAAAKPSKPSSARASASAKSGCRATRAVPSLPARGGWRA